MKDLQKTLYEGIMDDDEVLLDKIDNNIHVKAMVDVFLKGSKLCWKNNYIDKFGRELKIGDLVYCPEHDFVGIGVITAVENPGKLYGIDFIVKALHTNKLIHSSANTLIMIPKKCYRDFVNVITEK